MIKINVSFIQNPIFVIFFIIITFILGCMYQTDVYTKLNDLPVDQTFENTIKNVTITNNKNLIQIDVKYSAIFKQTVENIVNGIMLVGKPKNSNQIITYKNLKSFVEKDVIKFNQTIDIIGEVELQVFFYDTPLLDKRVFKITK